jgi:hypothetical protein
MMTPQVLVTDVTERSQVQRFRPGDNPTGFLLGLGAVESALLSCVPICAKFVDYAPSLKLSDTSMRG